MIAAWAWLPVAIFAGTVIVLVLRPSEAAWNSPVLLMALNTLFLSTISFLVTILPRLYQVTGVF